MAKFLALLIVLASVDADAEPVARIGAMVGVQRTDRSAWVFGPSLEVTIYKELSIRGEAQLELGDLDDPFGESNIIPGDGPHVNHVMFGPVWRPTRAAAYGLAVGVGAGVLVMHSVFSDEHFTKKPAVGAFVQAGRKLGPVSIALQLRFDVSGTVEMAGPGGADVPTSSGRINLAFEVPINLR